MSQSRDRRSGLQIRGSGADCAIKAEDLGCFPGKSLWLCVYVSLDSNNSLMPVLCLCLSAGRSFATQSLHTPCSTCTRGLEQQTHDNNRSPASGRTLAFHSLAFSSVSTKASQQEDRHTPSLRPPDPESLIVQFWREESDSRTFGAGEQQQLVVRDGAKGRRQ